MGETQGKECTYVWVDETECAESWWLLKRVVNAERVHCANSLYHWMWFFVCLFLLFLKLGLLGGAVGWDSWFWLRMWPYDLGDMGSSPTSSPGLSSEPSVICWRISLPLLVPSTCVLSLSKINKYIFKKLNKNWRYKGTYIAWNTRYYM